MIQDDGATSTRLLADATIASGDQPDPASVLEDSIEALVRAAYDEMTQIEETHADQGNFAGQPPPNVVSWADIEAYAESATDIGPQIRAELARYHLPLPERELPITPLPTHRKWPGRAMVALGLGAFLVLGVLRLIHGLNAGGPAHPPAVIASGASSASPPVSSHRTAAHPATILGVTATLRFTSRCWLRATGDGGFIREETVPAGRRITFHAKNRLELVLGNAGGVALRVNGKPMPTGRLGQVVHLVFTWRHGHVTVA